MRPTLLTTPDEAMLFVQVVTPDNQKITFELRRPIHATRQTFADLQRLELHRWRGIAEQWMITLTEGALSQECAKIRRIAERLGWTLSSQGLALFDEVRNRAQLDRRTEIDLRHLRLSSFPEEFGFMPCLQVVNISDNYLHRPPLAFTSSNRFVNFITLGNPNLENFEDELNPLLANEA